MIRSVGLRLATQGPPASVLEESIIKVFLLLYQPLKKKMAGTFFSGSSK